MNPQANQDEKFLESPGPHSDIDDPRCIILDYIRLFY